MESSKTLNLCDLTWPAPPVSFSILCSPLYKQGNPSPGCSPAHPVLPHPGPPPHMPSLLEGWLPHLRVAVLSPSCGVLRATAHGAFSCTSRFLLPCLLSAPAAVRPARSERNAARSKRNAALACPHCPVRLQTPEGRLHLALCSLVARATLGIQDKI